MRLVDILKNEIEKIEKNESDAIPFIRDDAVAVMVCVRFKGEKGMHYIMPDRIEVINFTNDLVNIIRGDLWQNSIENYKKQKLKPLIDDEEFKV